MKERMTWREWSGRVTRMASGNPELAAAIVQPPILDLWKALCPRPDKATVIRAVNVVAWLAMTKHYTEMWKIDGFSGLFPVVANALKDPAGKRRRALEHLAEAAKLCEEFGYSDRIREVAKLIEQTKTYGDVIAEYFDADMLSNLGSASRNPAGAWNGMAVRHLDKLVPENFPRRDAMITRLARLAGCDIKDTYVRSTLKR
jgi:hypothetical protein